MNRTDEQLIADYLEGDNQALPELLDRYLPDLCRFAAALTHDRQAAEDIAQESFVKAWKNLRRFMPGRSFRAWLFTIARRTAIDWLRQKKTVALSAFEAAEGSNVLLDSLADTQPLPDELAARAADAQYLELLLNQLNLDYREVLTLRHTSVLTFAEIGRLVGRPLQTVKSQYRRAVAALRRLANADLI